MDVAQAYTNLSDLYIELFGTPDKVHADDLAFIGRHLSGRVLDLGCGPGHLSVYLRSLGADVTGIDLVPPFLDYARKSHPEIDFRLGSMDHLEFEDVDGILSWYSLIHREPAEIDAVLAGFRRVMRPGGVVVVGFFGGDEVSSFDHKVTTAWSWPADQMAARLERAGFTEIDRDRREGTRPGRPHSALAARAV
ncbi:class I SAM-dependent methyltransferase [Actinoplanes sp. NPDC023714]|uniref:class I SAM-dependent methyltransferase n=1 Tax=Actinoplanes sp. NPDC023714 TaxID=3154322 RepID=UPI0034111825